MKALPDQNSVGPSLKSKKVEQFITACAFRNSRFSGFAGSRNCTYANTSCTGALSGSIFDKLVWSSIRRASALACCILVSLSCFASTRLFEFNSAICSSACLASRYDLALYESKICVSYLCPRYSIASPSIRTAPEMISINRSLRFHFLCHFLQHFSETKSAITAKTSPATPKITRLNPQSPYERQKFNNGSLSDSIADYQHHEDKIFYGTMIALVIHALVMIWNWKRRK